MIVLRCIKPMAYFALSLALAFAFNYQQNFSALYIVMKPEYHQLLEDFEKKGQEKELELFVAQQMDPQWRLKEEKVLVRLMGMRTNALDWTVGDLKDLSRFILVMSDRHKISPELVLSLIEVESKLHSNAVSPRGAMGLMQIKPSTAEALASRLGMVWDGPAALMDPKKNIEFGLLYIVELMNRYQKADLMLMAYNIGPSALDKKIRNGDPLPQSYYRKVMLAMKRHIRAAPVLAARPFRTL